MRYRWIAIVQLWACAALATEPGKDFSADIIWPLYAQRMAQGDKVSLHTQVRGCDDARIGVLSRLTYSNEVTPWQRQPTDFFRSPDGTYTTDVDLVEHVGNESMACWASVEHPLQVELQVVATCQADGRETTSQTLPVQFSPADFTIPLWSAESYFVVDANRALVVGKDFFALQSTWLAAEGTASRHINGLPVEIPPTQAVGLHGGRHEGLVTGSHAYISDACVFPYCHDITATDPVTGKQLTTQASTVFRIDVRATDGNLVTDLLQVPGSVVSMLPARDGSVLVVSALDPRTSGLAAIGPTAAGWIVSRIEHQTVTTVEVVPEGDLLRDAAHGSVVVARTGEVYRAHNLHFPHESQVMPTPGTPVSSELGGLGFHASPVSMAPEANQWTIVRGDGLWLSDGIHAHNILALTPGNHPASIAWQPEVLAVNDWRLPTDGPSSSIAFFDRRSGDQIGSFKLPRGQAPLITQVTSLSHGRFAATSPDAIAILDDHGNVLATTRLPETCADVRGVQELPDGRLMWLGGKTPMRSAFFWDIRMYGGTTTP